MQEKRIPVSLYQLLFLTVFRTGTYVTSSLFTRNILLISKPVEVCKKAMGIIQSWNFPVKSCKRYKPFSDSELVSQLSLKQY